MTRVATSTLYRLVTLGVVLSLLAVAGVGTSVASDASTFTYASEPGDSASVSPGETYDHSLSITTDAHEGPLMVVLYYAADSGVAYEGYSASVGDTSESLQVVRSTVTIDGDEMTRLQLVDRDPTLRNDGPLELTVSLETPGDGADEEIRTGGVHSPTGMTLSMATTALTVQSTDDSGSESRSDSNSRNDDNDDNDNDESVDTPTPTPTPTPTETATEEPTETLTEPEPTETAAPVEDAGFDGGVILGIVGAVVVLAGLAAAAARFDVV